MKKTLVLMNARWPQARFYINNCESKNADVDSVYFLKKKDLVYKLAALHMQYLKSPLQSIWYGKWKKHLSDYSQIIVFNAMLSPKILDYIHKRTDAKIIFWYWDTIDNKGNKLLPKYYSSFCEQWSFDTQDCIKYSFYNNIQFYIPLKTQGRIPQSLNNLATVKEDAKIGNKIFKYDFLIVMRDKGRYEVLSELTEYLCNLGYTVFTRIISDKETKNTSLPYIGKEISYESLVHLTLDSKCIIELVKDGQTGLTLRSMESIFYEKKLITNNKLIQNEEFYNPANVMMFDDIKDASQLKSFMDTAYIPVEKSVVEKYTFECWLNNFSQR